MKAASVFLRAEISAYDAEKLTEWLDNKNVTHYLNEYDSTAEDIRRLLCSVPECMLTCLFNRTGRFYMIYADRQPNTRDGGSAEHTPEPIGFVKLEEVSEQHFEIVFAVGEEGLWGRGYGASAVARGLSAAFLEERAGKVTARIYKDNNRSVRTAKRCGLVLERTTAALDSYSITKEQYLSMLRNHKII